MPIGNTLTPMIAKTQVTVAPGGDEQGAEPRNRDAAAAGRARWVASSCARRL
jgi:hypothetical protein